MRRTLRTRRGHRHPRAALPEPRIGAGLAHRRPPHREPGELVGDVHRRARGRRPEPQGLERARRPPPPRGRGSQLGNVTTATTSRSPRAGYRRGDLVHRRVRGRRPTSPPSRAEHRRPGDAADVPRAGDHLEQRHHRHRDHRHREHDAPRAPGRCGSRRAGHAGAVRVPRPRSPSPRSCRCAAGVVCRAGAPPVPGPRAAPRNRRRAELRPRGDLVHQRARGRRPSRSPRPRIGAGLGPRDVSLPGASPRRCLLRRGGHHFDRHRGGRPSWRRLVSRLAAMPSHATTCKRPRMSERILHGVVRRAAGHPAIRSP